LAIPLDEITDTNVVAREALHVFTKPRNTFRIEVQRRDLKSIPCEPDALPPWGRARIQRAQPLAGWIHSLRNFMDQELARNILDEQLPVCESRQSLHVPRPSQAKRTRHRSTFRAQPFHLSSSHPNIGTLQRSPRIGISPLKTMVFHERKPHPA